MHEATVTIKKLWPPYKAGDKRTNLEDTEGNKYRLEVTTGAGFHDGDVVDIGYTNEVTAPEFGSKEYKLIKKMKRDRRPVNDIAAAAPKAVDVGPHIAMWEKLFFEALIGKGALPGVVTAIEARRLARETLQADLDAKLPTILAEFNDDLESAF